MNIEALSKLSTTDQLVLYSALLSHIRFGDGYGLLNKDKSHLNYQIGASHIMPEEESHEDNTLYKAMKALSRTAFEYGEFTESDIVADWNKFCILVTKHKNNT
jgi:hypothetical protein